MLTLTIVGKDLWDERDRRFIDLKDLTQTITIEHSLVSISKWESKWKKAFLSPSKRTLDESQDYVRCMTITPGVNPNLYRCLTDDDLRKVQEYIDDPMSATSFRGEGSNSMKKLTRSRGTPRPKTSEQIYGAMVVLGIPFECQKWHLNRLLNLIHECEILNSGDRMNKKDSAKYVSQLNQARKAKRHMH